jgi:hypothetical protein
LKSGRYFRSQVLNADDDIAVIADAMDSLQFHRPALKRLATPVNVPMVPDIPLPFMRAEHVLDGFPPYEPNSDWPICQDTLAPVQHVPLKMRSTQRFERRSPRIRHYPYQGI